MDVILSFLSNGKILIQIIQEGGEYKWSYYYDGGKERGTNLNTLRFLTPNATALTQNSDI